VLAILLFQNCSRWVVEDVYAEKGGLAVRGAQLGLLAVSPSFSNLNIM
jgi:hypothetical protein